MEVSTRELGYADILYEEVMPCILGRGARSPEYNMSAPVVG